MNKSLAKILIIDDTPSIIDFIKDALLVEGYKIYMAISGEKGIEIAEQINPDIILLDVLMPGINGFETCVKLKKSRITAETPVIFMSALSEAIDKVKAFNAGAIDYLTKPVNKKELITRIHAHLAAIQKATDERAELKQVNSYIIKFLGEIVYSYDVHNNIFIWSDDAAEILDYPNNELECSMEHLLEKVHPNHQQKFESKFDKAIKTGVLDSFDIQIKSSNENFIWYQNRGSVILDNKGMTIKIIGILLNMSARKETELEQLKAIVQGVDLERKRIAAEIHDGLGQTLIAANLILNSIDKDSLPDNESKQNIVRELIDEAIAEGREISHSLMPKSLEDYGLIASIKALTHKIGSAKSICLKFHCNKEDDIRFPIEIENNLYRITQEALVNIIKHSEAKNVILQLIIHNKSLILTIEDDGKGFKNPISSSKNGLGIKNIKNRIASIDGMMQIDSNADGTSITIEVNL